MPTAPGFANCSYELKHNGLTRTAFITFGVDPTDTDPVLIAGKLKTAFAQPGSLFAVIDSNVTMVSTRVSLGTDGSEDLVGIDATPVACIRSLSSLPANCACLVHKITARGGRRGRGRMYIPWCCGSGTTNEAGGLDPTDYTAVANVVDVWKNDVATRVGPVVLLHRPSAPGTEHPTTPGPPNIVTTYRVDTTVATQRRRLGR